MTRIAVTLLGEFSVSVDGAPIGAERWKFKHPRLLWQMLCLAPGHHVSRDEAAEALWPQASVQASSNRLYHTLHTLRGILRGAGLADARQLVQLQAGTLWFDAALALDVDVTRFVHAVAAARACNGDQTALAPLERARALCGSLALPAAAGDWFAPHRQALHRDRVWVLEQLAERYQAAARLDDAVQVGQALVQAEPSNEAAHRRLIELYGAQGRPDLAAQQYTACSRHLRRDLGIEPSLSTRQRVEAIGARQPRRADAAPPGPAARARFEAPARATPLLGREAELGELQQWLLQADGPRLITIAAAGGIGKTRLAAALAEQVQDHFADGVHFIALSDVQRPSRLAERLCQALALSTGERSAEQMLPEALASRQTLLVLDRFEHLLEAAAQLTQWLRAAPRLRIVVTSQCALKLRAERAFELQPLSVHAPQAAVELFVQTAAHAGVDVHGAQQEGLVRRVCERLCGNALAIELAAAQLASVPLAALPDALHEPLQLLVGTSPDGEAQHASLQATIGWSVSLLAPQEAQLLALASVFAGDFSADDVQAVLGCLLDEPSLQASLRTLLDRHLLFRRPAAQDGQLGRFALADAVRAYAQQQAPALAQWPQAVAAHAQRCARVAAEALDAMKAGQHGQSRRAYVSVAADLERALQWHREQADTRAHLQLCWQAGCLMANFGVIREAVDCLEEGIRVVAHGAEERDQSAWCHYILARTMGTLGNMPVALRWLNVARALAKGSPDQRLVGQIGVFSAVTQYAQLRLPQALRAIEGVIRATAHLDARQRPPGPHAILAGCVIAQGDYARALAVCDEALEQALAARDSHSAVQALVQSATADIGRGQLDRAEATVQECRLLLESSGTVGVEMAVSTLRFFIAFERADYEQVCVPLAELSALCSATQPKRAIMVRVAQEFVLMETDGLAQVSLLRTLTDDEFPFALHVTMYVGVQAYRLLLQALDGDWAGLGKTLARSCRLVRRAGNAAWGARLAEVAAVAAQRAGQAAVAQRLLAQSRELLASRRITPTPRQRSSWSRTDALLRAAQPCAGHAAPPALIAALERLGAELEGWCTPTARQTLTLASSRTPPPSLAAA
jgi:DNA-binding SARP family transcriptional activator/predicted ATPase